MLKLIRKRIAVLMTFLLCFTMADMSALMTAYAEEIEETKETAVESETEESLSAIATITYENVGDVLAAMEEGDTTEESGWEEAAEEEEEVFEHSYGDYALTYTLMYGNAVITGYTGELPSELVIPDTIDGYTVTEIGVRAFDFTEITSVVIPKTVTTIGYSAFCNCNALADITLPEGISVISSYAFASCSSLESIIIPDSVTYLDSEVFFRCTNLKSVTMSHVKKISERLFQLCENLENVNLGSAVTEICYCAFNGCKSLKTIDLPDSIETIELGAFSSCESLTSITLPEKLQSVEDGLFSDCSSLESVILGNQTTKIGFEAFSGTTSLKSIFIPETVSYISERAFAGSGISEIYFSGNAPEFAPYYEVPNVFQGAILTAFYPADNSTWTEDILQTYGADSIEWIPWNPETGENTEYEHSYGEYTLTYRVEENNAIITGYTGELPSELVLPDTIDGYTVTEIGVRAFEAAEITSIVIPETVTTIGAFAFCNCIALADIALPEGISVISSHAFASCSSLESIIIPDSVTYLGSAVFIGCTNLKSVSMPHVKQISEYMFQLCENLESINLGSMVTKIGYSAFNGCKSLKTIDLPDSIEWIDPNAFKYCESLTAIKLPEKIHSVNDMSFFHCVSLESVTFGNQVTSIGYNAFANTGSLKTISIPETVTSISAFAFEDSNLSEIYFSGNAPEFSLYYNWDEDIMEPNNAFAGTTLTAFYPANNPTWTEDVLQPYGADSIEWIPWNPETEEIQGYIDVIEDSENAETEIGVHVIGSGDDLVLECNLPLQYFVSVDIDGVTVDPSNYELKSGSTIITFDGSFLDTLTPGNHTVTMHYNINGRKVAVKTSIVIREKSGSSDKPSKPNTPDSSKPSKPNNSDSSKPSNGSTGTDGETDAAAQNKVTMKAHLVDANGQPMYNCTLEIHSDPVSATLGTDGTASFKNIEVGDHTMYLKDQNGKVLASKAIKIVYDKTYSITGGDTIHVVKGRAFILNVKYDGENLILLSVEGDQTPATGDTSTAHIWILLMALSAVGIVLVLARKRKQIR